jgi:hypothetical protein
MIQQIKKVVKPLFLTFVAVLVISSLGIAQGDAGNDPDFPTVPLDGGLSLLLVAGAAYGSKKVYDFRKSKDKNPS